MFYEEGWVPLSSATAEVFRRLQTFRAKGKLGKGGLSGLLALSVWDICDASTKVGVTAPDGTVVPASKELVAWADPLNLSNEHLDLRVGSVGSSTLASEDGGAGTLEEMRLRYGPFLNLPVVIPTNNFQSSLTFLDEEVQNKSAKDPMVIDAAKSVLGLAEAGFVTRDTARESLGAKLSRRQFKQAWALAARHRPELSKPDRWVGI